MKLYVKSSIQLTYEDVITLADMLYKQIHAIHPEFRRSNARNVANNWKQFKLSEGTRGDDIYSLQDIVNWELDNYNYIPTQEELDEVMRAFESRGIKPPI